MYVIKLNKNLKVGMLIILLQNHLGKQYRSENINQKKLPSKISYFFSIVNVSLSTCIGIFNL